MQQEDHKRILVIGSYNVGFTCHANRLPVWGETLMAAGFSVSDGGKGANQAVAAAKLGGEVSFIGKVGNDQYAKSGLQMMAQAGVNTEHVFVSEKSHSGIGFILLNDQGENCIIVDPGANDELSKEDIEQLSSVIDKADIMLFQLENRVNMIEAAMKKGSELGKIIVFNPAPAKPDVEALIRMATIVTPNESELLLLSGLDPSAELTDDKCTLLARGILEKGPEAVIVTRGDKGALLVSADGVRSDFFVPKVKVVDSTGAGDSFNGALCVAIAEGKSLEEAVQFACYVGAYCVTGSDVIPSLPNTKQLEQFIAEHS